MIAAGKYAIAYAVVTEHPPGICADQRLMAKLRRMGRQWPLAVVSEL
jgi:hypothetical protein